MVGVGWETESASVLRAVNSSRREMLLKMQISVTSDPVGPFEMETKTSWPVRLLREVLLSTI